MTAPMHEVLIARLREQVGEHFDHHRQGAPLKDVVQELGHDALVWHCPCGAEIAVYAADLYGEPRPAPS